MSSPHPSRRGPRLADSLAPWATVALVGALLVGVLPGALAAPGDSAAEAIAVGGDGRFSGSAGPGASTWFRFSYQGGGAQATIAVEYQPTDSTRTDVLLHTGSPQAMRREGGAATRTGNTLTQTFSDPSPREVFIQFTNEHPDRKISFVGRVSPTSLVATPAEGTVTPTAGPAADAPQAALAVAADGTFVGTLGPRRAVWYRFWYGNPGVEASIAVSFDPTADRANLDVYLGSDPASLTAQSGSPTRADDTLSRQTSPGAQQYVYFSVANNNDDLTLAYSGRVAPAFATPTPVGTPTSTVTPTATAPVGPVPTATAPVGPVPTATPRALPAVTPQAAPPLLNDQRYFPQTRFRVDHDAIWNYFLARGQVQTFGFPVSRTFTFLGCDVQVFQRQIAQLCPGSGPALMNFLDDIFPYTQVNQSTFPAPEPGLKNRTPQVGDRDYATAILEFVRANSPDVFLGQRVEFGHTFFSSITPQIAGTTDPGILGLLNLEVWGAPTSQPMRDPNNFDFVYQRFQRGIMHSRGVGGLRVTEGILLADYLKSVIRDRDLPPDLRQQAQRSPYFAQYCPGAPGWLCRPGELPATDLIFAFEPG